MRVEKVVAPFVSLEDIEKTCKQFPKMRDVYIPVLENDTDAKSHALNIVNRGLADGESFGGFLSVELKDGKSWVVMVSVNSDESI